MPNHKNKNEQNSSPSKEEIQQCLQSLYSSIKTKMRKKVATVDTSLLNDSLTEESSSSLDPITLINYIKDSIDVLVEMSVNDQVEDYLNQKENDPQTYESILIKYESDIRGHIKVEHQLKLYADNLQYEIEQHEKEKKEMLALITKYKKNYANNANVITVYEKDIKNLKEELNELKKKNATMTQSEKNLKIEISKLNDENIILIEKIRNLKKKLSSYEDLKQYSTMRSTRRNSNSNVSTNTNNIPKRVIGTMVSQLTKRNKNFNTAMMNRSMSNYYYNNSLLENTSRSLSKRHDDIIKKINVYTNNNSLSKKENVAHHRNRSIGNCNNTKRNYDKINLIKDMLLKNNQSTSKGKNLNRTNVSNNSNNSSINSTMIYHGKISTRKNGNKKLQSSLIINNAGSTSYVNNHLNISTVSTNNNHS